MSMNYIHHPLGYIFYLAGRKGVFNVEVETKVDHVEDAMASQCGGQALI